MIEAFAVHGKQRDRTPKVSTSRSSVTPAQRDRTPELPSGGEEASQAGAAAAMPSGGRHDYQVEDNVSIT